MPPDCSARLRSLLYDYQYPTPAPHGTRPTTPQRGDELATIPHPELNPIELVWATMKHYCGTIFSNSTSFKEQRQHLEESFGRDITPEYCAKVYEHVQHIEERYWNTDLIIDEEIEIEDDEGSPF